MKYQDHVCAVLMASTISVWITMSIGFTRNEMPILCPVATNLSAKIYSTSTNSQIQRYFHEFNFYCLPVKLLINHFGSFCIPTSSSNALVEFYHICFIDPGKLLNLNSSYLNFNHSSAKSCRFCKIMP